LPKSAEGAKYDSQGQARSASPLDQAHQNGVEPCKGRNTIASISAFQASTRFFGYLTRGDVLRFARTCPWLSYFAPLALCPDSRHKPAPCLDASQHHVSTQASAMSRHKPAPCLDTSQHYVSTRASTMSLDTSRHYVSRRKPICSIRLLFVRILVLPAFRLLEFRYVRGCRVMND
jgi:hypothetical protein